MLLIVLHLIPDADNPYDIVADLLRALPSGSYVVLSHPASDIRTAQMAEMTSRVNERMSGPKATMRDLAAVTRFFDGLELLEPGVVQPQQWRPEPGVLSPAQVTAWCGVARKRSCTGAHGHGRTRGGRLALEPGERNRGRGRLLRLAGYLYPVHRLDAQKAVPLGGAYQPREAGAPGARGSFVLERKEHPVILRLPAGEHHGVLAGAARDIAGRSTSPPIDSETLSVMVLQSGGACARYVP
jgi:hypothetical protein